MTSSEADPFDEQQELRYRAQFCVLGSVMEFRSDSRELLALARCAFGGLSGRPARGAPKLRVLLRLVASRRRRRRRQAPPAPRFTSGAGLLCAHVDAQTFAIVAPSQRLAVLQIPADRLTHRYHVRYELIEFAAVTLAVRARGLVSLHAACVGRGGRAALLLGDSGAGKSTLTLSCALDGCALLSDDGVFANARDARLEGLPTFLHIADRGLKFVQDVAARARLRAAPQIRRRSGARKREIDVRRSSLRMARAPLRLATTLMLSSAPAGDGPLLEPLAPRELAAALRSTQPYAVRQPGWKLFERALLKRGGYRLKRGRHPDDRARAVRALLARGDA